jgi:hypothetical protein
MPVLHPAMSTFTHISMGNALRRRVELMLRSEVLEIRSMAPAYLSLALEHFEKVGEGGPCGCRGVFVRSRLTDAALSLL